MFAVWMHFTGEFECITPKKKGFWIVDPWHVQQVEPQTLIMEKIIMEKKNMEKIIMEKPVNLP